MIELICPKHFGTTMLKFLSSGTKSTREMLVFYIYAQVTSCPALECDVFLWEMTGFYLVIVVIRTQFCLGLFIILHNDLHFLQRACQNSAFFCFCLVRLVRVCGTASMAQAASILTVTTWWIVIWFRLYWIVGCMALLVMKP